MFPDRLFFIHLFFIHAYTLVLGHPPAEADTQRHFRVTPPSVHQMILTLEREGLIRRQPGVERSIEVLVDPEALPPLQPSLLQPVKSSVQRPKERARWTLRLLESKVVELEIVDRASDSTIGRVPKKTFSSPIADSNGSSRRRPTVRS
jgi:hypothetical protein